MEEPKYASLSAAMLARKGQAKPAMRPNGSMPSASDDLGWNDMGREALAATSRPVPVAAAAVAPSAPPPVIRQQAQLAREYTAAPVSPVAAPAETVARLPRGAKGKSAFTLRLDPERHVRLRLACAVKHISAQQFVTEALDALLAKQPEIEGLAAQLPSSGTSAGR